MFWNELHRACSPIILRKRGYPSREKMLHLKIAFCFWTDRASRDWSNWRKCSLAVQSKNCLSSPSFSTVSNSRIQRPLTKTILLQVIELQIKLIWIPGYLELWRNLHFASCSRINPSNWGNLVSWIDAQGYFVNYFCPTTTFPGLLDFRKRFLLYLQFYFQKTSGYAMFL